MLTSVLNGASQSTAALSPGAIVTLHGLGIGPAEPAGLALGPDGKVATDLNGAQVLFDGIPAPLLFASVSQINAIVPYETASRQSTKIQVEINGQSTAEWGAPLSSSSPGIFTLNGSGIGNAAVLNVDNSINSPSNPAARGTVIQIYATGEGLTTPEAATGELTGDDLKRPILPVKVSIAGQEAQILYAGSSPNSVAGLLQVNAVVPPEAPTGPAIPLQLTVGEKQSPQGATISVQ